MNRFIKSAIIALISAALISPAAMADNRSRARGGHAAPTHGSASRSSSRPANHNQRPANSGNSRPGSSAGRPTQGNRPGNMGRPNNQTVNPGHNNTNKPTSNPTVRPGNNHRPGNGNVTPSVNHRPGNGNVSPSVNHRPGNGNVRPGNDRPGGPGNNHGYNQPRPPQNHGSHGPMRPHMRPSIPFSRPTPPPAWRPAPGWRPFRTILGVALGTALNISINSLINSGYTVASYGNNEIYLNNVPMLNLMWPDAIMYYNAGGALYGSRFIYSTPGYNMNQYNMAYTSLTANYGAPVSIQALPNGTEATWWGPNNQFIRLSYQSDYANNGLLRYYTTLSFGN